MSLQWADGAALKQEMDSRVAALLGPRTADDDKPLEKPKKEPKKVRELVGKSRGDNPLHSLGQCSRVFFPI
jgi:hypothetical protein